MKKIVRMVVFSAVAIYVTSLWNKGFTVSMEWKPYLEVTLLIAAVYYILIPLSKVILIPFNVITLGLASVIVYFLLFYLILSHVSFIVIKSWKFPGISIAGVTVKQTLIGYKTNIILSSVSISTIINLLEALL